MPTPTYNPLATVTLGSSASSVTFSSIPATFRDLVLVVNGRSTSASDSALRLRFNADSGSNYTFVRMFGDNAGPGSSSGTATGIQGALGYKGLSGIMIIQIMDYSATDKHKTVLSRENLASDNWVAARASRHANTSAVTTIGVTTGAGDIEAGTTLNLFGIAS